ncbi:MAG: hypothetical protein AUJ72_05775 [Candidatus Omnitrophica bacterium CG1_02_46_14]|nr:MAG: hypothetical protein AUJ72_05775 [Candidatus Omnitrophica bacterium CG1_02_46_14]
MAKIGDILKIAGDMVVQMFLGRIPESQWIPQMRGPYDPNNGWMKDIATAVQGMENPSPKLGQIQKIQRQIAPSPTPTAMPTPALFPKNMSWDDLKVFFAKQANKRGYHRGALVGQKALESERGQSNFAKERHNYGGIGAYDSYPNQALSFNGPEDYMDYYDKMIQKRFPKAYEVRNQPKQFLEELKAGNYATDPDYVWKIVNTPEYREYDY